MSDIPRLTRRAKPARIGIVHLGPGGFFRAFNAVYTADAMAAAGGDWGICAVSLKSRTVADRLAPQNGVFTSVALAPEGPQDRVIDSVSEVLVLSDSPDQVLSRLTDPRVHIVSLTVTEKGYCHDPATGRLNPQHPDIVADLAAGGGPRSVPGLLVAALARRRADGTPPFTALSCDNLPANGRLVRKVVVGFARLFDPELADWIARQGRFPSTMVDRITPAATENDIAELAARTGYHDPACTVHEPFRQWVIEDDFAGPRPAWDRAGAQIVADVAPYERMKLRCLNGTHSALAYLGYLAGHESIAQTVADPVFSRFCQRLWRDEILPTICAPEDIDLSAYCDSVLRRYMNSNIHHRTWQIAADGSQKLPQRILAPAAENLAAGRVPSGLALAVAGWMVYVGGVDLSGHPIDVRDPMIGQLQAVLEGIEAPAARVQALLSVAAIFPPDLRNEMRFIRETTGYYERVLTNKIKSVVAEYLAC